jgi:hypothetical protein
MTFVSIRRALFAAVALCALIAAVAQAQAGKFDVTGTWAFEVQTDQGGGAPTMVFKQEGEKLTGKYTGTFGSADLTGTVKGADINFTFSADAQGMTIVSTYKGTIENATSMKGTLDIAGVGSGTFTAKKK